MIVLLVFSGAYFLFGQDFLVGSMSEEDKAILLSYDWYHMMIAAIYPVLCFLGIHLLYKKNKVAPVFYIAGASVYVFANVMLYSVAIIKDYRTIFIYEDAINSFVLILFSFLVFYISKRRCA